MFFKISTNVTEHFYNFQNFKGCTSSLLENVQTLVREADQFQILKTQNFHWKHGLLNSGVNIAEN